MSAAAMESTLDSYHVPALARGLNLLGLFSPNERRLTGAEMARRLTLPRASVFRMLYTLEQLGFVERVASSSEYSLGVAVLRLGFDYLASQDLTDLGRPAVDALRDSTGMTAHLVIRDQREVVFILKALGRTALFQSIQVGARLPAHATALGRCLLSGLSDTQLSALYTGHSLARYTAQTPDSLVQLQARLVQDRVQGYSLSEAGFESGISTIAAPVRNAQQGVVASLSITVPASRIEAAHKQTLITQVCEAAQQLSQRLAHVEHQK
jgi:DNA-binding IclR family transcriptional regulator